MNRTFVIALGCLILSVGSFAADQGASASPSPGTESSNSPVSPSVPAAVPGPFPSQQTLPVSEGQKNSKHSVSSPESQDRQKRIHVIQKKLKSKTLSAGERHQLNEELATLNVQTSINQPTTSK